MGFGKVPEPLPQFILHGQILEWTNQHKYLGVHVTSCRADIFSDHFEHKAKVALKVTNVSFTLLNYLGDLPPREGLILYKSRVDPHLTHGAEVALGVSKSNMALLGDVQVKFLRRLLRVQKHSMRTPLFTETGILPIQFCRVAFALKIPGSPRHDGGSQIRSLVSRRKRGPVATGVVAAGWEISLLYFVIWDSHPLTQVWMPSQAHMVFNSC